MGAQCPSHVHLRPLVACTDSCTSPLLSPSPAFPVGTLLLLAYLHLTCTPGPAAHLLASALLLRLSVGPVRAQSHGSPRAASGSPFGLGIPPSHSLCAFSSRPQAPEGKDYFAHIRVAPSQSQEFVKKKRRAGKEITCMSYASWASENGTISWFFLSLAPSR